MMQFAFQGFAMTGAPLCEHYAHDAIAPPDLAAAPQPLTDSRAELAVATEQLVQASRSCTVRAGMPPR